MSISYFTKNRLEPEMESFEYSSSKKLSSRVPAAALVYRRRVCRQQGSEIT